MILKHPISGHETAAEAVEWLPGCAYFQCPKTKLQWLDPQPEHGPGFPDFSDYSKVLLKNASEEDLLRTLPPNENAALEWITKQIRPRAKIVELFAEAGRFAWLLRAKGFEVCVSDPLANHVSVLRSHNFDAEKANSPDDLPDTWSDADAVIILESIVRVAQPGAFMHTLRRRFPKAKVFITAPSLRRPLKLHGVDRRVGYPPDFLTRWTKPALLELFHYAGYEASSRVITPLLMSTVHKARWRGKVYVSVLSLMMKISREYEFSLSAWGTLKR